MDTGPRTMLQVAALLGVLVIGTAGWILGERRTRNWEEADLIAEIEARTERPDVMESAEPNWDAPPDLELESTVLSLGFALQSRILPCIEQWPLPPNAALLYVESDEAGRLTTLAVKGAPEAVQSCLRKALKGGRFPRGTKGVAELPLSFR